jgi:hypothetical protein
LQRLAPLNEYFPLLGSMCVTNEISSSAVHAQRWVDWHPSFRLRSSVSLTRILYPTAFFA